MTTKLLRLRTFGGLWLESPEGPLPEASAQRRRLALLVLAAAAGPAGLSRDKVLVYLWPESEGEKARHALAQLVYAMRQQFKESPVLGGTAELRLDPEAVTSDLGDFRLALERGDLEQAAALYTGPFLDGFFLHDAPEFERWVEGERTRLATKAAGVLEALAQRALSAGQPDASAAYWRRLSEAEPLNSRFALGLMGALEAQGNRAGALQHAKVHATLVRKDLEAEPDPAVMKAMQRLRSEPNGARTLAARAEPGATGEPNAGLAPVTQPTGRPIRQGLIVGVLATLLIIGLISFPRPTPRLDPKRVLVAAFENRTGDSTLNTIGLMAADWITQGLAQVDGLPIVDAQTARLAEHAVAPKGSGVDSTTRMRALAEETGAGTVVWGSYYRVGDSLEFQARISDATRGEVRRALEPVRASPQDPERAVQALRQRTAGALALLFNRRQSEFIAQTATPPSYPAYQAFMEGMDLTVQWKVKEAVERFTKARELDSSFAEPLIWAGASYLSIGDRARADSFLTLAQQRRERLSPFDRALLDSQRKELIGDIAAALDAAREMARIAPGSEGSMVVGEYELELNRPREALRAFALVDPDRGWVRGWSAYWGYLMMAHHLLGENPAAVRAAREARKRYPESEDPIMLEVVALAPTGNEPEIVAELEAGLALREASEAQVALNFFNAILELRAHAHPDQSARVVERARAWLTTVSPEKAAANAIPLASLWYACGEPERASALLERAPKGLDVTGLLGLLAEARHDRPEAERIDSVLASDRRPYTNGKPSYWRARMAAARGDKEAAVSFLREALTQGYKNHWFFHSALDFQVLKDYAPFQELIRPKG